MRGGVPRNRPFFPLFTAYRFYFFIERAKGGFSAVAILSLIGNITYTHGAARGGRRCSRSPSRPPLLVFGLGVDEGFYKHYSCVVHKATFLFLGSVFLSFGVKSSIKIR